MISHTSTIINLKAEVLYKVAQLAYEGELEERMDEIPYEIIPGPKANFRCCIYKEREIIRQRVRLAKGQSPVAGQDNKNIVQTITSACEDCPITRFVVTDNCRKCLAKKCQENCNFGAISMGKDRAYIDSSKCKECGKCAQSCQYNAIADLMRPCKRSCPVDAITMDENNIVKIDEDKCIQCGHCIKDCPFGAISDRSFIVDVINLIKTGVKVYAMLAPAGEGQFGNVTMGAMRQAVKDLGFADMYEVALGGDMTADAEAAEWAEAYKEGKKMTTSCCPAFVNMIKKHYPEVLENMSTTVSPMVALSRFIKANEPDCYTVFIGPCIAKKDEVNSTIGTGSADYALTFEELHALFRAKDIDPASYKGGDFQQGSAYGKRFGDSGGVTAAVVQALKEQEKELDINVMVCNGETECKKGLLMLKLGKLPQDFIEGMICEGGCVNGPGSHRYAIPSKKDRNMLLANADKRDIKEALEPIQEVEFSMHRH